MKNKMTPVTPAQGKAVTEYIENMQGIDINDELTKGEEADKMLRPYVVHLIRMGAAGTDESVFVDNVEYRVSIRIERAERQAIN